MGWISRFFDRKINQSSPKQKIKNDDEQETLECNPDLLAQMFVAWVVTDLNAVRNDLKIIGQKTWQLDDQEIEKQLTEFFTLEKGTALFRQLCLFYDGLWYRLLLPQLIAKTGRVRSDQVQGYITDFRQKCMEAIATAEHLPIEWRSWPQEDAFRESMQTDFKFYMHQIVPKDLQDEFEMILNFTNVREGGEVLRMIAWLHMRTREILGLMDKKEHIILHAMLWKSQSQFTLDLIKNTMNRVVPVSC